MALYTVKLSYLRIHKCVVNLIIFSSSAARFLQKEGCWGIQFYELFKEDLYFVLAEKANKYAAQIAEAIKEAGYEFLTESATNQIFPILPKTLIGSLHEKFAFYVWKEIDESRSAVRLITSWATDQKSVDEIIEDIKNSSVPE
jgi:threonine aldolase